MTARYAHRHWAETGVLPRRTYPPRGAAGCHYEQSTGVDGTADRVAGARGDGFVFVEQRAVDVASDERRQYRVCH
jgi:hypothetical protein